MSMESGQLHVESVNAECCWTDLHWFLNRFFYIKQYPNNPPPPNYWYPDLVYVHTPFLYSSIPVEVVRLGATFWDWCYHVPGHWVYFVDVCWVSLCLWCLLLRHLCPSWGSERLTWSVVFPAWYPEMFQLIWDFTREPRQNLGRGHDHPKIYLRSQFVLAGWPDPKKRAME